MSKPKEEVKTIGRYEVQQLLGEGAMGSVFKAFDPVIKRVVALKTIKLDQSRNEEDQREFIQRFFQEAQISGILNHPNIVSIYDIGEQQGMPYIAMEYVEGRSLQQIIHEESRPEMVQLATIVFQVATALEFAHAKGIVHRDLKPGNIMVMPNGLAKIMDFGIAKMSGSHLTQTGVFLGTPSFASPEQIKEGQVDYRSDIFSLGILAHETLTGETPFPGQSISAILYKIANEPPKRAGCLKNLPVDAPKWIAVFEKVFQKDPAQRYQSAAQFGQDLLNALILSEEERAKFGTFVGQIHATVRSTFGIQKDIQRSEYEMAQAPKPAKAKKSKNRSPLLWLAVILMFLVAGAISLWNLGFLGSKTDISSIIPTDLVSQILSGGQVNRRVVIETEPAGAALYVDGKLLDHPTPWPVMFDGVEGQEFTLKLEKEGFFEVEKKLILNPDMEEKITILLEVAPMTRSIQSVPKGAQVRVDGKSIGNTPLEHSFLPGKSYEVEIKLSGYQGVKVTYREGTDSEKKLNQELKKILPPGKIRVTSAMEDLKITFSGKIHASPLSVPPGSHRIKLASQRYFFSQNRTVKVESGKTIDLETPPILTVPKIDVIGSYAKVKIDGRFVKSGGQAELTPIIDLKIAAGRHVFEFVDDDGKIIDRIEKDVTQSERIIVDFR